MVDNHFHFFIFRRHCPIRLRSNLHFDYLEARWIKEWAGRNFCEQFYRQMNFDCVAHSVRIPHSHTHNKPLIFNAQNISQAYNMKFIKWKYRIDGQFWLWMIYYERYWSSWSAVKMNDWNGNVKYVMMFDLKIIIIIISKLNKKASKSMRRLLCLTQS